MRKLSYALRVITVPPLMALVMLLTLFLFSPGVFGTPAFFAIGVASLVVLPLLAYPLQPLIPPYKDKGREGQRALALVFSVAGYILGCVLVPALGAPQGILIIVLSYLLCGLVLFLSSKLLHFKASGHACGVTGPFLLMVYFGQPIGYIGVVFLALAWVSSLHMKRHTVAQLAAGTAVPFLALGILHLVGIA